MESIKSYAVRLKNLRQGRKLKVEEVAEQTGISARALRSYEEGVRNPKDDTKITLCKFYEVPVSEIFFSS